MGTFWDNAADNIEQAEKNNGGVFEVLPAGEYTAVIADCEMKDTKAGNGKYVNMKLEITGPTHQGRVIFETLNLFNPSEKAVEIAVGTLHRICEAANNVAFYDTMKTTCLSPAKAEAYLTAPAIWNAVGNRPITVKLGIKKDDTFGDKNTVKQWKAGRDVVAAPAQDKSAMRKPF